MDKENFGLQITDEDIEWVRTIMPDIELDECRIQILKNMNSVDIHACPGSGKTTILNQSILWKRVVFWMKNSTGWRR